MDEVDAPPNTKNLALGVGCLALFALPFAAVGVFIAGWAMRDLWNWSDSQQWVETPARLLSAELDEKAGEKGGRSYEAKAHYRYAFGGRDYESRRVGIVTGRDNVGTYQQDRSRELLKLLRAGQPTVCYVDPDEPSTACLYRDFRPGHFSLKFGAGLLFGGVGLVLLTAAIVGLFKAKREAARAAAHPDEPWRWRDSWQTGRLRSDSRTKAWVTTGIALFWNAIAWPALIGAMTKDDVHWGVKLVVVIFPLIGAGLASLALYCWLQYRRWGVSEFEMAAIPGVLGGPLAGVIYAPGGIDPKLGYTLRLACVRRVKQGDSTKEITLWSRDKVLHRNLSAGDGRTLIPVQFVIPYDLPPSQGEVTWKLTASAAVRGADYRAEFQPPVFRTAASSPQPIAEAADRDSLYAPPPDFATFVARLGAELEEDFPDRRTIYFPMLRSRELSLTLIAITLVLSVLFVGFLLSPIPRLFVWGCGGTALLMGFITVNTVFERTRLTFGQRGIVVEQRVLRSTRRELAPEHIESIAVMPSGTTVGSTSYQKIVARELAKHDPILLVNEIANNEDAERLAEEIRRSIFGESAYTAASATKSALLEDELPDEFR